MFPECKEFDKIPKYIQLELFPPTQDEVLFYRILGNEQKFKELEGKLDRQRKAQFGKIGSLEKKYADLEERLALIEKGICQSQAALHDIPVCEIVALTM